MVKLSFILPLYNLEDYIIPCLHSIVSSLLDKNTYEVLVWNDGSSDNSPLLVEQFAKNYPQVKLINSDNQGVSWSRNAALKEAKGDYVWFVDSDDLVIPENVHILLKKAEDNKADALLFNWQSLMPDGVIEPGINQISEDEVSSGRELYLGGMVNMAPWSFIYKKEFLVCNNLEFPIDYKTCEDIQFNQKVLFLAKTVVTTSLVGYLYRHRNNSATKGQGYRVVCDHIRRLKDEVDYFSSYNDWEFLSTIIYRNLREINVWLFWADRKDELIQKLKETLKTIKFKQRPIFSIQTIYFNLMKLSPKLVFEIQLQLNIIKRKLKGQYVKQNF